MSGNPELALSPISSSLSLSSDFSAKVPWEIVVAIVRETDDPSTLAAFSLVCFDLLKVAGPLLWRDIYVDSYFKMACLFHEPSPPPPPSSRLQPHLGLHLMLNLHFFLPPPPLGPLLYDRRLNLPRSRLPNPSFHLPINHVTLEWRHNEPLGAQLQVFAHLDPKTYSQIYHPAPKEEEEEESATLFEIVESDQFWITNAFMRWTRLFKISSSGGVLHCGKHLMAGFENNPVYLPFTGEFVEALPYHVLDFRRRESKKERSEVEEKEGWKRLLWELGVRGVRECKEFSDGGIEFWVSEKEDERRLLEVLELLDAEQRRKYKVTVGKDFNIHEHKGPDNRRPGPPRPPPIVIGGH